MNSKSSETSIAKPQGNLLLTPHQSSPIEVEKKVENPVQKDTRKDTENENARLRLALREMHHRNTNQWQFLIGLADEDGKQSDRTSAMGNCLSLRTMLHSFAMLNKTLDTGDISTATNPEVSVRAALESVMALLQPALGNDTLDFSLQDALLSEKGCAALMLACTELVCNAAKYGKRQTQVVFSVEGAQGRLEVHDDGAGFPEGFQVLEGKQQGLQLVEALCRFDLNGEMQCQSDAHGGIVTLTFPIVSGLSASPVLEAEKAFCAMEGIVCFDAISE